MRHRSLMNENRQVGNVIEVGERLKEARQAKGYTLDDLQQITKIQKRYLVAIEEGNLNVLPGNFYARAFIKQYADTVGLNGDQLLSEHTDTIPSPQDKNYVESVAAKQTRAGNKKDNIINELQQHLPTILVVILVIAITGAIYIAINQSNKSPGSLINQPSEDTQVEVSTNNDVDDQDTSEDTTSEEDTSEEDTTDEETNEDTQQTVEVVSSTGSATTYAVQTDATSERSLVLEAVGGQTWVSVTVDGATANQGLVESGSQLETMVAPEAQSVLIVIGNASATVIYLNEEEIPYAEQANEAVRQEITLEFNTQSE